MARFWDDRARCNAAWYVDTSIDYGEPDMDRFFATGRAIVAEALDDPPGGALEEPVGRALAVEIGSGLGRVCRALAERFEAVVGLDVSEEMVRRARGLVTEPGVRFEVNDGRSLRPLGDGTVDLVLSFTVFQHLPRMALVEGYIEEAARVLRPGGLLVFQWNNTPGPWRWWVRRTVLVALQRTGLRPERHRRHSGAFLGCRIPVASVTRAVGASGLSLRATKGTGSLFAWAWATKP